MGKPRVLLFEAIHESGVRYLSEHGCDVIVAESLQEECLVPIVRGVSAIIVRSRGTVSRRILDVGRGLRVIGRHGVGIENIDVAAAHERGIWVVNTPEANAESVAEHFLLLALMLSRKVLSGAEIARRGPWEKRSEIIGQEFFGKTVGIVGFGRVGRRIASICNTAFSSRILFATRRPDNDNTEYARLVELNQLLREADYVSLNVPHNPSTHRMIGRRELSLMNSSAFIINTSNGKVWDEESLYEALHRKTIGGAATDVFATEPLVPDNRLLTLQNFVATPHVAAQTEQAMLRMAAVVEDVVRIMINNEAPRFPVPSPGSWTALRD